MREEVELSKEEVNAICAYLVANVKEFRSMDNAPETLKRLVARASVIDDEMDAEMARNGKATIDDVAEGWSREEKDVCLEETAKSFEMSGSLLRCIMK